MSSDLTGLDQEGKLPDIIYILRSKNLTKGGTGWYLVILGSMGRYWLVLGGIGSI